MYIKVTPGNEVVGIQKHTLYVISYIQVALGAKAKKYYH